jgi:hypothetical protein
MRFSLIRLSDGVHLTAVAAEPWRTVPERKFTPIVLNQA